MQRRRALLALLAASSSAVVHAFPSDFLSSADSSSVCPRKSLVSCSSSLPSNFCCPQGSQCQSLAGSTTAVCCPDGSKCDRIQPIPCDVALQDPDKNDNAMVLTSVFDVKLQSCDNGCCPFGYTCADKKVSATGQEGKPQCIRDDDQSKKPSDAGTSTTTTTTGLTTATSTATSSTGTSTSTSSHSVPASATSSPTPGADPADTEKGMKSRTMSIIGGVIGGTLVLLILIVVAILYIRRRKNEKYPYRPSEKSSKGPNGSRAGTFSSSSSHSHARQLNISEPIVQKDSYRTDFMLKSPSTMSSISNQPINSRWSGSTNNPSKPRALTASAAIRRGLSLRSQQQQKQEQGLQPPLAQAQRSLNHHLSIPNPFNSPNPSVHSRASPESAASSFDESQAKTGHVVNARLAPIRSMRSSRRISRRTETQHVRREASEESINVFADANAVPHGQPGQPRQQSSKDIHDEKNRMTTFSDLMERADLSDFHHGRQPYVPGTTPRL